MLDFAKSNIFLTTEYNNQTTVPLPIIRLYRADNLDLLRKSKFAFTPYIPRKDMIHPQLPLGMPCYDLAPVTDPTFGPV